METTTLKIVHNNKNRFEVTDAPQEREIIKPFNEFQKWLVKLFNEIEQWGSAAGKAIRN